MGFPDRIERTIDIESPRTEVWAALTTDAGLGTWFGNGASVDLRPGGIAHVRWDDGPTADLRIERIDEPVAFGFTWRIDGMPDDDPRRTYVEFTLAEAGGGTRLTVVETGFAQLPDDAYRSGYDSHTEGWGRELGELVDYLRAGAVA